MFASELWEMRLILKLIQVYSTASKKSQSLLWFGNQIATSNCRRPKLRVCICEAFFFCHVTRKIASNVYFALITWISRLFFSEFLCCIIYIRNNYCTHQTIKNDHEFLLEWNFSSRYCPFYSDDKMWLLRGIEWVVKRFTIRYLQFDQLEGRERIGTT